MFKFIPHKCDMLRPGFVCNDNRGIKDSFRYFKFKQASETIESEKFIVFWKTVAVFVYKGVQ